MFLESKINIAIQCLQRKTPILIGNLRFEIENNNRLIINGWSSVIHFNSLRKEHCIQELQAIKLTFQDMLLSHPQFEDFIHGKEVTYRLLFDDYGKGSIFICSENQHHIHWYIELVD